MQTDYDQRIHQFLAGYRFFAFALAAIMVQVLSLRGEPLDSQGYFILSLVGVYTLLKVFSPLRWWESSVANYFLLGGDLVISVALLLVTNGLVSGYLAYSLTPVLTAALLTNLRISLVVASLTALAPTVAHLLGSQFTTHFAWIMESNHAAILFLYIAISYLTPVLASRSNLNILRRIENDAVVEERRRIRREVHDGVAQTLSFLNMQASAAASSLGAKNQGRAVTALEEIRGALRSAHDDVRELLDQLVDQEATQGLIEPLANTLGTYVREFGQANHVEATLDLPKQVRGLSPRTSLQLARIAQEALTNVRKHAHANHVWVTLQGDDQGVELRVRDDGIGLSDTSGTAEDLMKHHGLTIMRERAESLGGTLEVTRSPEGGTVVRVAVPQERGKG